MSSGTRFAVAASGATPALYDAIRELASAAEAETGDIEALVGLSGSAAVETATELCVEEILCEFGYGHHLAATLVEFRVAGSPTRAAAVRPHDLACVAMLRSRASSITIRTRHSCAP